MNQYLHRTADAETQEEVAKLTTDVDPRHQRKGPFQVRSIGWYRPYSDIEESIRKSLKHHPALAKKVVDDLPGAQRVFEVRDAEGFAYVYIPADEQCEASAADFCRIMGLLNQREGEITRLRALEHEQRRIREDDGI